MYLILQKLGHNLLHKITLIGTCLLGILLNANQNIVEYYKVQTLFYEMYYMSYERIFASFLLL